MTPLFHSFYYMQLNVFYLTMERLQSFAEGKYDLTNNSIAVVEDTYMEQLTDAARYKLDALLDQEKAPYRVQRFWPRTETVQAEASVRAAQGSVDWVQAPKSVGLFTLFFIGRGVSRCCAPA